MRLLPLLAVLVAACAQNPQPLLPAVASAPPPSRPDIWAQSYLQQLGEERKRLRAAGLGADWDAVLARVEVFLPRKDGRGISGATPAQLREMDVLRTTNFLVRAGYRPRHLTHSAQATTLVRAADSGWHDADALVLVSPAVFVADFIRVDRRPDNSADLVFRVSEPIKNAPVIGSEHRVLLNGPFFVREPKPGDPPSPPPPPNPAMDELSRHGRALFFLMPDPNRPGALTSRGFFGPMPVQGERVLPGYHSTTRETTLEAIRAAARAQLCSPGYVPVARGVNLPQAC